MSLRSGGANGVVDTNAVEKDGDSTLFDALKRMKTTSGWEA